MIRPALGLTSLVAVFLLLTTMNPTPATTSDRARFAPSFSCSPRQTASERAICADPVLAKLDVALTDAYGAALRTSRDALEEVDEELLWLRDVRNACTQTGCLRSAYRARTAFLQKRTARAAQTVEVLFAGARRLRPALRRELAAYAFTRGCLGPDATITPLRTHSSLVVTIECFSGNDNVTADIFLKRGETYRPVLSVLTCGIDLQTPKRHGLPRIRVRGHASGYETGVAFYDFDGVRYRPVACGDDRAGSDMPDGSERYEISRCDARSGFTGEASR